jgi:hypothetical protein
MMKQVNIQFPMRMLGLILGLFLSVSAFAQIDVKGNVKDAQGEPLSAQQYALTALRLQPLLISTVTSLLRQTKVQTLPLPMLAIKMPR